MHQTPPDAPPQNGWKSNSKRGAWVSSGWIAFLALACTIVRLPLILEGTIPGRGDALLNFLPFKVFAAEQLRNGTFPLWTPNMFCGQPFFADPQSALLSPFTLWFLLLGPRIGFTAYILSKHVLVAGCLFGFLRHLGMKRPSAVLAGLSFTLSSTAFRQIAWQESASPIVWLPLFLWLCERILEKPGRFWSFMGVTAVATAMNLAGHPQNTYYAFLLAGAYLVVRTIWRLVSSREKGAVVRSACAIGFALALSLGLSVVQILPLLEFTATTRYADGFDIEYAAEPSLRPSQIPWVVLGGIYPDIEAHDRTSYISVLALLLVPVGILVGRGMGLLFAALGAGVLLISMGLNTPVFESLYRILPGFGSLHDPTRILLLLPFTLSILSGFGLEGLLRWRERRSSSSADPAPGKPSLVVGVLAVTGVLVSLLPWAEDLAFPFRNLVRFGPLAVGIAGLFLLGPLGRRGFVTLVILVTLIDVVHFDWIRYPFRFPLSETFLKEPDVVTFTRSDPEIHRSGVFTNGYRAPKRTLLPRSIVEDKVGSVYPNMALMTGIHDPQGLYSLKVERYTDVVAAMVKAKKKRQWVRDRVIFLGAPFSPLFDLLNMKYLFTTERGPIPVTRQLPGGAEESLPELPRPASALVVEVAEAPDAPKAPYRVEVTDETGAVHRVETETRWEPLPEFSCFLRFLGPEPDLAFQPEAVPWQAGSFVLDGRAGLDTRSPILPFPGAIAVTVRATALDRPNTGIRIALFDPDRESEHPLYSIRFGDEGLTLLSREDRGRTSTRALETPHGVPIDLRFTWAGDKISLDVLGKTLSFRDLETFRPDRIRVALGCRGGRVRFEKVTIESPGPDAKPLVRRLMVPLPHPSQVRQIRVFDAEGTPVSPHSLFLLDPSKFRRVHTTGRIRVIENLEVLPRALLVRGYAVLDEKRLLADLADPAFRPRERILFEEDPGVEWEEGPARGRGEVIIESYDTNRIEMCAEAQEAGFVFLSDTFFPGWQATVNGKPTEILRANHAFRAIAIGPGTQKIVLAYRPRSFFVGAGVSGLSLVIWLALPLARITRRRRRNRD